MAATVATYSSISTGIQLILEAHRRLQDLNTKPGSKTSHNELERGRRAHLRKHMEELKSRLTSIPPGTRLTTLVILRAARDQIRTNRHRNEFLQRSQLRITKEYDEAVERHRYLTIELQNVKDQIRRSRCSGSVCSTATTMSDESEVTGGTLQRKTPIRVTSVSTSTSNNRTGSISHNGNSKVVHFSVVNASGTNSRRDSGYGSPSSSASPPSHHYSMMMEVDTTSAGGK